jgi:phospholipid/cholesterol/gamma-HCH transport system substrate-binding protein
VSVTRLVRLQLIAFVVVTVLGMGFAMFQYVGLGRILGVGQYPVSMSMPAAGGLYANAVVTERGVTVGKVDDLHLTDHGVVADLSIDNGAKIPANLAARVANTSAVGEQYLELTPKTTAGPYLTAGAVIPASEVTLPPSPSTLLANLNTLLQSVPRKQLTVTVNELYNAFNGTGPALRQLLDSSSQLLEAATANLAPTQKLIGQSTTVLATQARNAANIKAFSRNLAAFTTALRNGNGDLAGAIDQAPGLTTQLNNLIGQLQPTIPLLLDNLTATGQVLRVYLPNLRQFLVIFPADINDLTAVGYDSPDYGTVNTAFKVELNSPCTTGYQSTMRQPSDTAPEAPPTKEPYCTVSHGSSEQVRGDHNDPCPNNPLLRAATAAGCGLNFGTAGDPTESGGDSTASYGQGNGLIVGPDNLLYSVGPDSLNGNGPTTLQGLLKETLGGS